MISYINYPIRIYYIGRLDKDSEGLLLLTNQGELVNKMMRSGNQHEKEYVVTVNKPVTKEFIKKMQEGVPILGTKTRKCRVIQTGEKSFRIILTQGLNRQIRRMCQYLGYEVKRLKRIRVMNIELGDLPVGSYREVMAQEMKTLQEMIKDSSEITVIKKERGKKCESDRKNGSEIQMMGEKNMNKKKKLEKYQEVAQTTGLHYDEANDLFHGVRVA